MSNDNIDYYTLHHPDWSHARLVNHEAWDSSFGHTIGTWEHSFIRIPEEPSADTLYLANMFKLDGKDYIVHLNGEPLSTSERLSWPSLNCETLGKAPIFKFRNYTVCRHIKRQDGPLVTLLHPDLKGEYIVDTTDYNHKYGYTIGSSPECYITLPDPKLLPFIAHMKTEGGHHKMLLPLNGCPPYEGHALRNSHYNAQRIDNGAFHFWGYLIFQCRDITSDYQASLSERFRESCNMHVGKPPEREESDEYDNDWFEVHNHHS